MEEKPKVATRAAQMVLRSGDADPVEISEEGDPVSDFWDLVRDKTSGEEVRDMADAAQIRLLEDCRDLLAVIAGSSLPVDRGRKVRTEYYIEDGRLKKREVPE